MRFAGSGISMRDSRSFAAGLTFGMGFVMPEWMRGYLHCTSYVLIDQAQIIIITFCSGSSLPCTVDSC